MEDENEDIIMNGNGMGNGVIPERRHSSTEGSRSSRGEVVTVRLNRRHSLPGGSSGSGGTETSSGGSEGCVIEIHGDRETGSEGSAEVIHTKRIIYCLSAMKISSADTFHSFWSMKHIEKTLTNLTKEISVFSSLLESSKASMSMPETRKSLFISCSVK